MPSAATPADLDFSTVRVLVVGDLMVDRYLRGRVQRISPEAPVPIVSLLGREDRLGGAANVVANLQSLGMRAGIAGAVGADASAELLVDLLHRAGVAGVGLVRDPERPTTVKTRILAQDQQLLRLDEESTQPIASGVVDELLDRVRRMLAADTYDVLILQDYNKGALTAPSISGLIEVAEEFGVGIVVDPKEENFWAYRGVDLFKPNLREMQQQVDFPVTPSLQSLDRAAEYCFSRLGCRAVMITLSEHGIYSHDGRQSAIHPTHARRIIDVSGAGDTVVSLAAGGLGLGMPMGQIARLANLAGAQVIARPGVVAVDRGALVAEWLKTR